MIQCIHCTRDIIDTQVAVNQDMSIEDFEVHIVGVLEAVAKTLSPITPLFQTSDGLLVCAKHLRNPEAD